MKRHTRLNARPTIGDVVAQYDSIAALKAARVGAQGATVQIRGYSAAGDGGGGLFRWDPTDTSSADNGGTILTPTSSPTPAGRWKRVYEGEVNARWFGVNPSNLDNTAALQAAVDWVRTDTTRTGGVTPSGGGIFIPAGYYRFKLDEGTSGLSTITISSNYVYFRGEGKNTVLAVSRTGTDANSLFTWTQAVRGQGGGIRDVCINGASKLKNAVTLSLWRDMGFHNISLYDIHGWVIDAVATTVSSGATLGENLRISNIDYIASSGTNSCLPTGGIRFTSSSTCSWSDCFLDGIFIECVWYAAILLDGVCRFEVNNVRSAWSGTSSNTVDGSSKTGVLHAVHLANSVTGSWATVCGQHTVRNVYLESHSGVETPDVYVAVLIDIAAGVTGYNMYNRIENVNTSWSNGPGTLMLVNNTGTVGRVYGNTFIGNRMPASDVLGRISIGTDVRGTYLYLTPNFGRLGTAVVDNGTQTYINNVINKAFTVGSNLWPNSNYTSPNAADVGQISVDTATGRVVLQDAKNDPHLIGPRPGLDVVAPYGPQRIQAMPNPATPVVVPTPGAAGATTYTYYVVAIDKDGNKTVPSSAGTTATGPATLTTTNYLWINWAPVPGAVKYDLLKGDTGHSIATNLVATHFQDDGSVSTSAYTPSGANPAGTLTVDSTVTASATIELGHATDTTLSRVAAGRVAVEGVELVRRTVQSVTSAVTLGALGDYIVLIGASGAPTLPTAVSNGGVYRFKNVDTGAHTIATTSAQTIEGLTTYTLPAGAAIDVVSDGSNWRIL